MRSDLTFQQIEALRLYLLGYTQYAAAREMDIDRSTYSRHLNAAGIKFRNLPLMERVKILNNMVE